MIFARCSLSEEGRSCGVGRISCVRTSLQTFSRLSKENRSSRRGTKSRTGPAKIKFRMRFAKAHASWPGENDYPTGPNFLMPAVLADVTDEMLIARGETFGPVAAMSPVESEGER